MKPYQVSLCIPKIAKPAVPWRHEVPPELGSPRVSYKFCRSPTTPQLSPKRRCEGLQHIQQPCWEALHVLRAAQPGHSLGFLQPPGFRDCVVPDLAVTRGLASTGDATSGNAAWITPYEFDSWWTNHNLVMSLGVKPMAALFHMVTAGFVHWRNRNSMGWSALFHQIQTWHWIVGKNDVPMSRSIRWLSWTTSCEFDWRL